MRWPAPLEALVAANVAVFSAWVLGSPRWMTRHFEVSWGSLLRRPWTLATATLSHSDLYSLIGNLQVPQHFTFSWSPGSPLPPIPAGMLYLLACAPCSAAKKVKVPCCLMAWMQVAGQLGEFRGLSLEAAAPCSVF